MTLEGKVLDAYDLSWSDAGLKLLRKYFSCEQDSFGYGKHGSYDWARESSITLAKWSIISICRQTYHGLKLTERDHFRNYASYVLKQGTLSEKDDFIRGLNVPLFVENKRIFRRFES